MGSPRRLMRAFVSLLGIASVLGTGPARAQDASPFGTSGADNPAPSAAPPPPPPPPDEVLLDDGRVVRARVASDDGKILALAFPSGEVRLPRSRVREVRLFKDYDPAPRDDAERAQAAKGLVRWGGRWVAPGIVKSARAAEERAAKKRREENEDRWSWSNRWILNTAHFSVEANLGKKDADHYSAMLEAFYDYFTSAFKVSPNRRIPVRIFRTKEEFDEYRVRTDGATGEHTVGYFVPRVGHEELVLYHDRSDVNETVATLLHECTHLLLHLARPEIHLPTWANEGLAEYYSAVRFDKGRIRAGLVQEGRLIAFLEMADKGRPIEIDRMLLAGHPKSSTEFGLDHYAQAWAMVHYLMQGKEGVGRSRLGAYLNEVWSLKLGDASEDASREYLFRSIPQEREAFRRCFKAPDPAAFLKEVVAYARTLPVDSAASWLYRARKEREKEPSRPAAVLALLDKALERAGSDALVLSNLAWAYSMTEGGEGRVDGVAKRLLDVDPLDAATRAWMARYRGGVDRDRELSLALEIDPSFEDAPATRAWLAYRGVLRQPPGTPSAAAEAAIAGNATDAVALVEHALGPAAGDERAKLGHAMIEAAVTHCWKSGKNAEAHALLSAWHAGKTRKPVGEAGWILRCGAAARAGKRVDALGLLKQALETHGYSDLLVEILDEEVEPDAPEVGEGAPQGSGEGDGE